jgi:hypothetical protein
MEMELDLVLNQTGFKFFVKISKLDERFHKNKNKLEPRLKVPFEIKNWTTQVKTIRVKYHESNIKN